MLKVSLEGPAALPGDPEHVLKLLVQRIEANTGKSIGGYKLTLVNVNLMTNSQRTEPEDPILAKTWGKNVDMDSAGFKGIYCQEWQGDSNEQFLEHFTDWLSMEGI